MNRLKFSLKFSLFNRLKVPADTATVGNLQRTANNSEERKKLANLTEPF